MTPRRPPRRAGLLLIVLAAVILLSISGGAAVMGWFRSSGEIRPRDGSLITIRAMPSGRQSPDLRTSQEKVVDLLSEVLKTESRTPLYPETIMEDGPTVWTFRRQMHPEEWPFLNLRCFDPEGRELEVSRVAGGSREGLRTFNLEGWRLEPRAAGHEYVSVEIEVSYRRPNDDQFDAHVVKTRVAMR